MSNILIYKDKDGLTKIDVRLENARIVNCQGFLDSSARRQTQNKTLIAILQS